MCRIEQEEVKIEEMDVLLALLDAYEVTRDEGMLQEVLDVVSGHWNDLTSSPEAVKLLAYCYYYVEEEECMERAWKMVEELKEKGMEGEKVAEAETILREMMNE